jgi:uncharacterized membrane protein
VSQIELILLARAIHIMAGVTWAGATFMLAGVIVPMGMRHGPEGAGRWIGMIVRRMGPISGISAVLTVLSGMYLFMTLHSHDSSTGGLILSTGAVAALLSLGVGLLVGRPTGLKLAQLAGQIDPAAPPPPSELQRISSLQTRAMLSSRVTAALLGIAVLSMALFRYAQAIT